MASEGSPAERGCLLIAQSAGIVTGRPGTQGSKGVPANSRRRTSGLPTSAPSQKSLALPIELTARTRRESRPSARLHGCGQAAVDKERRAGDVARAFGAEEDRGARQLLDGAEPAGRNLLARRRLGRLARSCGGERALRGDPSRQH